MIYMLCYGKIFNIICSATRKWMNMIYSKCIIVKDSIAVNAFSFTSLPHT